PRRPYPPYTYAPLPSPHHIRLIHLLSSNPSLSQVFITLTPHRLFTTTNSFAALSYTWGAALEPFEPNPALVDPAPVHLVVLPPEAFETLKTSDDLLPPGTALVDLYTPERIGVIPVTGNLAGFFRSYMRGFPERHLQPREGDGSRLTYDQVVNLWVDAVCIDQGSAGEKMTQIPLMGEVYSRAGMVLAWLGGEESMVEGFGWWHRVVWPVLRGFLEGGGEEEGESPMGRLRRGNMVDGKFWREVVGVEGEVPGGSWAKAWMEFWAFYRTRKYFHRSWIVQEVVVARGFDIMAGMGGELKVRWEEMIEFVTFLGYAEWLDALDALAGEMLSPEYTDLTSRGFMVGDIASMQQLHAERNFEKKGWPEHWWAALSAVRRRDCFIKQDKVFAAVGILLQALPEGTPLPFPVDTAATPNEVYTHAATAVLRNRLDLAVLSFVEYPIHRNLKNLPSWVPDLTTPKFPWALGGFDTRFKACPPSSTSPPRKVTPDGKLHLRGFKIDTITTKTQYEAPMNVHLVQRVLAFLADLPLEYPHMKWETPEGIDPSEVPGIFREVALVLTLTCGESSNYRCGTAAETQRVMVGFRDWLLIALGQIYAGYLLQPGDEGYTAEVVEGFQGRREEVERVIGGLETTGLVPNVAELRVHGEAASKARREEGPWSEKIVSQQEFKDQIRRVMLFRTLFRTEGEWIGVCTETCRLGDELWLLEGGAVPYVLRPTMAGDGNRRFMFCGECYVQGGMHGELMEGNVEERWKDVVLV
ncbi:hypothetical protein C8A05DRAFT_13246, partial [Staphylotrichum tortipilum]